MFDVHITAGHIIEGLIGYAIVHGIVRLSKYVLGRSTERTKAIWLHYQYRAKGEGHQVQRVENCQQGYCALIGR